MRDFEDVHKFWFVDHSNKDWFGGKPEFDTELDRAFRLTHEAVARGEAWHWRADARGRVCEIVVLDQFSRQLHRESAAAFAQDAMALALAQEMVAHGLDKTLSDDERYFVYMPYMHSESLRVHAEAVRLFTELGNSSALDFERRHVELIQRFGRYPKRNAALGRISTPEEIAYIAESGDGAF